MNANSLHLQRDGQIIPMYSCCAIPDCVFLIRAVYLQEWTIMK